MGSRRITLRIPVNVFIAITVVVLGMIGGFVFGPDTWHPYLVYAAAALAGGGGLMGVANAMDARTAAGTREKRLTAMAFARDWNNPHFFHAKTNGRQILEYFKKNGHIDDQKKYIASVPALESNLNDVLNFFEALAVAIALELAEDETAKRFFRSIASQYWNAAEAFIRNKRAERNNARLYQELEWLCCTKWKD